MANLQALNQQKKQFYTMHSPTNVQTTFIRKQKELNQYYSGLPIRLLVTQSCTATAVPKNNEQI